jgi:hypothetical protein
MSEFFHFTDARGARAIGRYGLVIPRYSIAIDAKVSWFTDDITLDREALGLTMRFIANDRMEFLYRVIDATTIEPFLVWAKRVGNPFVGRLIDDRKRPEHWFVSSFAVPVRQVRAYVPSDAGAAVGSDRS